MTCGDLPTASPRVYIFGSIFFFCATKDDSLLSACLGCSSPFHVLSYPSTNPYLFVPTQTADLREELAVALGRAKEAEALLDRGRADLERLEEGQRRAQTALDAKNQEVGTLARA